MAKATLEAFAEAVAAAGPKPGEIKANGKFLYVHCPEPGPDHDPHQANSEPRVWLMWKNGGPVACCHKCLGPKDAYTAEEWIAACQGYTDKLKARVGWQPPLKREVEELRRHHYYSRDLQHIVAKKKVKLEDGKAPFWWDAAPLEIDGTRVERYQSIRADEFLAANYPDFEHLHEALHWYGLENLEDPAGELPFGHLRLRKPEHIVICEGEHDCDTFNGLGLAGWFATCLSHPKPRKLCAHHLPLIDGARVVVIPDRDTAGGEQAQHWAGLLWDRAESVKRCDLPLPGGKGKKDLTDWVEAGGTAAELLRLLDAAEPWLAKPMAAADANSGVLLGLAAVEAAYLPWYLTADGRFYSKRFERVMKFEEIKATIPILKALENARETLRDNLGQVKPRGLTSAWRECKEAILGELRAGLPSEDAVQASAAVESLEVQLAHLMASMVTINPGDGEQRHAIGSWARRYAEDFQGGWRQVKTYQIWGRLRDGKFQIAFRPELASAVNKGMLPLAKLSTAKFRKLCAAHGLCEPTEVIEAGGTSAKVVVLTELTTVELNLVSSRGSDVAARAAAALNPEASPLRGEVSTSLN